MMSFSAALNVERSSSKATCGVVLSKQFLEETTLINDRKVTLMPIANSTGS